MRGSSETNILKQLLLSRLTAAIDNGSDLFGLSRLQAHDDEEKFLEGIDALVSLYPNLELLIDAMIQDDKSRGPVIPTSLRFEDVARRIGAILAER